MTDTIVLFEDEGHCALAPLVHSRPVFELRCGIYTLRERLTATLGVAPEAVCRGHLAAVFGAGRWPLRLLSSGAPVAFVNGRALSVNWLPRLLAAPINTVYVVPGSKGILSDVLLGARLSPAVTSAVLFELLQQRSEAALHELRRFANVVEIEARMLAFPWDIITENAKQIAADLPLFVQATGAVSAADLPPDDRHIVVRNPAHVFIHPDARLDGPLVLDARDGPLVLGAAHVEPFSFVQGPAFIGNGTLIASARIRGETSIGPVCRIGGEVEASVIQGYSNKHHDGFLGHSYLGEWVNIGAMTTNSDLKNTYGSIKVVLEQLGQVDSGQIKLGCFLADHVKLGIGVHLTGGSVIGVGSNIFGIHSAPKTVLPFTWGGDIFHDYQIDRMIGVTRKVMSRRKIELQPAYETLLRDVFALTRGNRVALLDQPRARGPLPMVEAEAALARAEAEAMHAYEAA